MLEHLSPKFKMPPMEREPRAALILNRFTRTLTVMFATNAVSAILGVSPNQIKGKSFYECIQENCLRDAIKCLESAKANDSIAYLRFWYRDPRREEDFEDDDEHEDVEMEMEDGCKAAGKMRGDPLRGHSHEAIPGAPGRSQREPIPSFELEAAVSCTSDGLVVVLRKARPPIPAPHPPLLPLDFENGLFAAPWGMQSITPDYPPEMLYTFRPPLLPQYMPLRENVKASGGPPLDQLMRSIRDVAVFAWALVGINGNLASYSRGVPPGGAQPPDGLPIWDPTAREAAYRGPENHAARRWATPAQDDKGNDRSDGPHYNPEFSQQPPSFQGYPQGHAPPMWPASSFAQPAGLAQLNPSFPPTLPPPRASAFNQHHIPQQHAAGPQLGNVSPYTTPGHKQYDWAGSPAPCEPGRYNAPAPQPGHDLLKPFYKWS
jgi:hypothetical protein